tara:strand:+ start:26 stop:271 length:246 start_codon:yes stop_codon:yes gene_type:complete
MSNPNQIVALAAAASEFEPRPADAAALLIDAAAMLFVEANIPQDELMSRLAASIDAFSEACEMFANDGNVVVFKMGERGDD